MSLNVNTAIYSAQGVDINNAAKVASQILANAKSAQQNQPTVQAIDYSKFNRAALGIDLYSSRTNADLQKQISLTQAGLYAKSVDVAKLNSQAAMNLYSARTVQKNVELTQSVQVNELIPPPKAEKLNNNIKLFNIADKNASSSNGFNPFEEDKENSATEEKNENNFNLFA